MQEKEKMLVTSIFSFSHNVYKRLIYDFDESRDCLLKSFSWFRFACLFVFFFLNDLHKDFVF